MAKEKLKLPTWEECELACKNRSDSALERYIFNNEPANDDKEWRKELRGLLLSITAPDTRQRAERAARNIVQFAAKDKMQCPHQDDIAGIIAAEFEK